MGELYLVRHGIAVEHGTPGIPDDERPLTPEGERRMHEVARGLAALKPGIERIATSPLPRAHRTAEILAEALKTARLEIAPVLRADSSAQAVAEWLDRQPKPPLLIVGHNPILDELLSLLLLGDPSALPFEFKKGGVAALERPPQGRRAYSLRWAAPPKLLRLMAD